MIIPGPTWRAYESTTFCATADGVELRIRVGQRTHVARRDAASQWCARPHQEQTRAIGRRHLAERSSTEAVGDGSGPWRVHFERSDDAGRSWSITPPPPGTPAIDVIQPTLLQHVDGRLQAIGRTRQQRLFSTWSTDDGKSWTPLALLDVPNPNSGIDAATLKNGTQMLVCNPSADARTPLSVAVSTDGVTWQRVLDLETEPGEYSYPAIIQTHDGRVHITYTWRRQKIKHVVIEYD